MAYGVNETVVDAVHGQAVRLYAEGLRQYLALRVGNVGEANQLLAQLRAHVTTLESEDLLSKPGIRARLFRIARDLSKERAEALGDSRPVLLDALPWRVPIRNDSRASSAVSEFRRGLEQHVAELLELRYARELDTDELAYVLDLSEEAVEAQLAAARTEAEFALSSDVGKNVSQALVEAFALVPRRDLAVAKAEAEPEEERPSKAPPVAPDTVLGGRYRLVERVGSGAFADVYRAHDTEVKDHVVALKLLHASSITADARESALRELRHIASVFHPSVVQFKDHGWYENRLWFVMPWYDGETLEDRMKRAPLSRRDARRVFKPLAQALAAMHGAGMRHQDIKPDNIFLATIKGIGSEQEDLLPVLLDLGVAAKEAEMVVAGTPTYFAPEVAAQFSRGAIQFAPSGKSDVFSLALALRNALSPDLEEDVPAGAVERFIAQRADEPVALPDTRDLKYLSPYFERWLHADPNVRPSAEEFAEQLDILIAPEEYRARRNAVLRSVGPLLLALGALFAAVIIVLNEQAAQERSVAKRARMEAATAKADLNDAQERSRELATRIRDFRERYRDTNLTKQQLQSRLGKAEGELSVTREDLQKARAFGRRMREMVVDARRERDESREILAQTERDRARAERLVARLEGQVTGQQRELAEARNEASRLRAIRAGLQDQVDDLGSQVQSLEGKLAAAKASQSVLEERLNEAERDRVRLQRALRESRQRTFPAEPAPSSDPVSPATEDDGLPANPFGDLQGTSPSETNTPTPSPAASSDGRSRDSVFP